MPKGPLRIALDDAITTNPFSLRVSDWWSNIKARLDEASEAFVNISLLRLPIVVAQSPALLLAVFAFVLTGWRWPFEGYVKGTLGLTTLNVSGILAPFLRDLTDDPAIAELAEVMGSIWVDPILGIMQHNAGRDDVDPMEMARRFLGIATRIGSISELADMGLEFITAGQVESKGRGNANLSAMIGISTVSGEIFRPLLNSAVQPGMERYYQKLYRPMRFSAGDLRDLYALGKIDQQRIYEEARLLGWREDDIQQWIDLAFKNINESDLWQLYHAGQFDTVEMSRRLRALGYAPQDIPRLFTINQKKEVAEAGDITLSTARAAYRDDLLSEAEFRAALAALKKSTTEIALIVAIENRNKLEADQRLSVGQIKAAWSENVLTDTEAIHWLISDGLPFEQVEILLRTWRKEIEPRYRKLNKGTLTAAYVAGILNRSQTQHKLVGIGFSAEDAALELDLTEAQNPAEFGKPPPKPARLLTPGNLAALVVAQLITPDEMRAQLVIAGYTDNDARLLSELAHLQAAGQFRVLSQATIERAYVAHVLTRDVALRRLLELGLLEPDALVVLTTIERTHPEAFAEGEASLPRALPLTVLAQAVMGALLTEAEYLGRARELDYTAEDAALFLAVVRQSAAEQPREASQSTIERAYVLQVIDRAKAAAKLGDLGFGADDVETILQSVERDNPAVFAPGTLQSTRQPSMADLVEALRSEIITELEYFARAKEAGYDDAAARIFLSLALTAERKSVRKLSDAKVLDLYAKEIFSRSETERRLMENGYNQTDADLLMRLERSGVTDTQTWSDFLAGLLTIEDAIQQLLNQGFTLAEVEEAFNQAS